MIQLGFKYFQREYVFSIKSGIVKSIHKQGVIGVAYIARAKALNIQRITQFLKRDE